MHSTLLVVASLALFAVCACAPVEEEVIQHIPAKQETPSAIGKDGAESGASVKGVGVTENKDRARRDIGGQESDLLPSVGDVDASPFSDTNSFSGRSRIRVLPAFLG